MFGIFPTSGHAALPAYQRRPGEHKLGKENDVPGDSKALRLTTPCNKPMLNGIIVCSFILMR